ncbi:hypothetical protein D3C72_2363470 [compost metagenome]
MLLDFSKKTLERLDATALQGLVVLDQQMHRALCECAVQGRKVAVVGKVTQGHLQPFGPECLSALQRGDQLGIGFRLAGQPQFHG